MQDSGQPKATIGEFDPELYRNNTHDAFCEFVSRFQYEYEAIMTDKAKWTELNKRKVFLGRFASRNLQRDYESAVAEADRANLKFADFVTKMKARYEPTRNYTLANYQFHRLHQQDGESFDNYVHRLYREAESCSFSCASPACDVVKVMIRDQLIVGVARDDIRQNALKNQWDVKQLIENGRKMEAAAHTAQLIRADSHSDNDNTVARIKPKKYSRKHSKNSSPKSISCSTCSDTACNGGDSCRARTIKCFTCGQKGHFQGSRACKGRRSRQSANRIQTDADESQDDRHCCKQRTSSKSSDSSDSESEPQRISTTRNRQRRVHKVQHRKTASKDNTVFRPIDPHNLPLIRSLEKPKYVVKVTLAENRIKGFADTGADLNVMSEKTAKKLDLQLSKTKTRIRPFGSKPIKCVGSYKGFVSFHGQSSLARFYVVPLDVETLLSGGLCEDLGIIKFNPAARKSTIEDIRSVTKDDFTVGIMKQYPTVFKGVGTLKNHQVHFYVNKKVPPVAQSARPVPYHLRPKFDKAISQMEEDGIIEEHHGPAPWVSNVVLTPKDNGNIRVTIDMREVNKSIKPTNIPIPRVEDIKAKLSGCKIFSKLDFKSAFHQLSLDKDSQMLTVFHAGQRLMHYRKLTMGAKPASGELTKALIPIFSNRAGIHVIHDDIIIAGKCKEEHDMALHAALQKIKEAGMTLNPEKCILRKKEIPFWGMVVTKHGIKPDPAKVKALAHASRPQSKDEVMSFLCFVQSFGDFIPLMSRKTSSLRKLTKKYKPFHWSEKCESDFIEIRKCLQEDALLRYFDTSLPTFIFVDAHTSGISAILAQGNDIAHCKPVTFASRATRPEEQRYPQLDLEATAVDFGLRRFRNFITGGPTVLIITDHKPLVSIFSNTRKGSIHTDRIKLRHQDIPFQVIWEAGQSNPADYLSRHAQPLNELPTAWQDEAGELERTVFWLKHSPYTEAISMDKIRSETRTDGTLRKLKKYMKNGHIPKDDASMQPYRKFQDQITLADGFIMKNDKIILPQSLWSLAIDKAHQGHHPGMTILKKRIREHFWIPGLNKLAENKIKLCKMCQLFTNPGTKHPQKRLAVPELPWEEVSVDLFGPMPDHKHVLVVQDTMSRFPDAKIISSTGAKHVIPAMQDTYKQYGRPTSHKTDNGPPFNGQEFKNFSDASGILHKKAFPRHPQANPVETFMKTLGKTMKICHMEGRDKQQALNELLANYRSTPHMSTGQSPGNVMLRGGYQHDFPKKVLSQQELAGARQTDEHNKITRQMFVNSSCKRRASLVQVGDHVIIRNYRQRKFDPIFGPDEYKVVAVFDDGVKIKCLIDGKVLIRHVNDVKLVTYDNSAHQQQRIHTTDWWTGDNSDDHTVMEEPSNPGVEQEDPLSTDNHTVEPLELNTVPHTPLALSRLADYNSPGYSELEL